ncbi:TniB family NTP-binding protein [Pseudomonas chlororaphis]|uniref:TniB family NTP-binding protein n=1 Tax=Pseudomonas chlororaphis TaxID=587753 RepID=UPI002368306A|nr:TniB family NTP-binding protein [Pseudomonas chlororaphis]WDH32411.1 TniB family NTP-binding protein [Pseudomonas chlororaphis]WDH38495.1 TniB family NTP-binding protein [Pseudomonas chlororaphis]
MKSQLNLEHIASGRRELALLGDRVRIRNIFEDCWVNYPQVSAIRAAVRAVYEMPLKTQSQSILVSASAGMGKTSLLEKIESDLEVLRKRREAYRGYISFSLSSNPTMRELENRISEALGVSIGRVRNGTVPETFCQLSRLRNVRLMLIDEVHNLLLVGRVDQRKNLAFFRALSSPPMSLSIIAFGTDDAFHAISSDAQLERRFQTYELPRWRENDNFRKFLATYESSLPLKKPSELWRQDCVKFLLSVTGGITDAIVKRVTRGAVWAILDGKEKIDLGCLEKAADIPPYLDRFDDEE